MNYAVVGSGAAGIASAYYLMKEGHNVDLYEKEDGIGGRIRPFKMGKRLMQLGGKNIGKNYTLFRDFVAEFGCDNYEYFGLNSSQVRNGKMFTVDGKHKIKSVFNLLKSGTPKDIYRFIKIVNSIKGNSDNCFLGGSYLNELSSKLYCEAASRCFSKEFCKRVIRLLSVRMNGAEPDEIYIGNLGTNICMLLDSYEQLTNGMGEVLDIFATKVNVYVETEVINLLHKEGRVTGIIAQTGEKTWNKEYDGVILATQAPISANLIHQVEYNLAKTLTEVRYYPVKVIVAEYLKDVFSDKVRALVFDDTHAISNAGVYGVNDKNIIRYTFSGRYARSYLNTIDDDAELLNLAEASLDRFIPVRENKLIQYVAKGYKLGLCAYVNNYQEFREAVDNNLAKISGLFLAGDYMRGASIEACFRSGQDCANQIKQQQLLLNPRAISF